MAITCHCIADPLIVGSLRGHLFQLQSFIDEEIIKGKC